MGEDVVWAVPSYTNEEIRTAVKATVREVDIRSSAPLTIFPLPTISFDER